MKNLSRADLLQTLYELEASRNPSASSAPSAIKNALAGCLGFQYKAIEKTQKRSQNETSQEQGEDTEREESSLQPLVAKNRYWYINFIEPLPELEEEEEDDIPPLQVKQLKQKQTTILPSLSLKSVGEWQNLFDASLKQAQKSKKTDIPKSIKHLSQNKPADNLPKEKNYGFNKTVCIVMERTEALRPAWSDMREIWQRIEWLVGEKNMLGYALPTGMGGNFEPINKRTPRNINELETDTLVIYIGVFGALHTGEISTQWQQYLKKQQQKGLQSQLYSLCPIDKSAFGKVHQLDSRKPQLQALNQLVKAIQRVWLINDRQLRYLREETSGASLHTELVAFNHPNISRDSQFLWHKHNLDSIEVLANTDNTNNSQTSNAVKSIVKKATQRWENSRSDIAIEMEQLLTIMHSGSEEPKLEDYKHIENMVAKSQQQHALQNSRDINLSLLRSILPDLEILAKRPALKEWGNVLREAQFEAVLRGLPLPLREKGLQSTNKQHAFIRQQNNQLQLVPSTQPINPAQNLLTIGNQSYCEETNQVLHKSLPHLDNMHIQDQGSRYQLTSMRKPKWAERIWHDTQGLHGAHEDGTVFQLQPANSHERAKSRDQTATWQGIHNAWNWISDSDTHQYGIDKYGLWAILTVKNTKFRLRWIPAGSFLMGSPEDEKERYNNETQHKVTLTKGYWLAETSVTQAQWQAVMGRNPSDPKRLKLPVNQISWDDCQVFIKKLQALVPNLTLQLPTEAQWEYACRAGTTTAYWWGDEFDESKANSSTTLKQDTDYPQNNFGLHSMSGNLYEWCNDFIGDYPEEDIENPEGSRQDSQRVLRGGSWFDHARGLRSANRSASSPDYRGHYIGLRLAGGFDPQATSSEGALTADRRAVAKPIRRQSSIAEKLKGMFK